MAFRLSIIIVNWNTLKLLDNCLNSITFSQTSFSTETIVVDNASTDGSVEIVKTKYPWIKLIKNKENVGFARANNQGFKESSGRHVMFLNSDTIVKPHAIDRVIEFMDSCPGADIAGPKLLNEDGSLQISAFKLPTLFNSIGDLIFGFFNSPLSSRFTSKYGRYDREIQVGWVSGACLVAKREAIEKIGGWDETFFMYSEDVVMGIKAKQYGLKTFFFPGAEVIHLRNKSSNIPQKRIMQIYESRIKLRREYFNGSSFLMYLLLIGLIAFGRAMIYSVKFLLQKSVGREASFARERVSIYIEVFSLHIKSVFGG